MIYLIGGPPKCGKTTLAKSLAKELGIPWIQGDTLQSMFQSGLSKKELKAQFPWKAFRNEVKYNNDISFKKYAPAKIASFYIQQARVTDKAIMAFIESEFSSGQDYIIEGYQIHPTFAARITDTLGRNNVRTAFLVKMDSAELEKGFQFGDTKQDWILKGTSKPETFSAIAAMISQYSERVAKDAKKHGFKTFRTDAGFKTGVEQARAYLSR